VVFGVQSTVKLLPALVPPFDPVYLFGASGPVFAPLRDAAVLAGVAVGAWLAFHGGSETLRRVTRSRSVTD
jgi:hypothetical protein